jgi:hypothetical protein
MKKKIAYDYIIEDTELNLSEAQKKEIEAEAKRINKDLKDYIRRFYRIIAIPDKSGVKEVDLGIPTYGEDKPINEEIYEKLKADGEILEKISPIVIKEKYLSKNDWVLTEKLYQSFSNTPGEPRVTGQDVLENSLREGIIKGLFGLGDLEDEKPICLYFKESPSVISFSGNEIIVKEEICRKQKEAEETEEEESKSERVGKVSEGGIQFEGGVQTSVLEGKIKDSINLKFKVPKGKVSDVMGILNYLQSKFDVLNIEVSAKEGSISEQEYEDKIEEALRQSGIELDTED